MCTQHCQVDSLRRTTLNPDCCVVLRLRITLQMEASITSDFPSLLALNSMRAGKYDGVATPPELAEKPKYLPTAQYKNGTVVSCLSGCGA